MSKNSSQKGRQRKAKTDRPAKPYKEFPLYAHPLGYWSKKIKGKIRNFGRWGRVVQGKLTRVEGEGWKDALELYKAQADDLHAGRTPRVKTDGLTMMGLCNAFLTAKKRKLDSGELGARMFQEYKDTTDLLIARFGKDRLVEDLAADDFENLRAAMAERWGPVRLGNAITRVKSVFKYGIDNGLADKAIRYGSEFKKPTKSVLRKHRANSGDRMLEADQLRKLLDGADPQLRAMIHLGLNAGFGNNDCASLPLTALDVDGGWLNFPRPKTGIPRRCPLWPETAAALKVALAERLEPRQAAAGLVFVNARGLPWVRNTEKSRTDTVSLQFGKLLKKLKLNREGLNFYSLRHVHRTIADAARDQVACDIIMGHSDPSMGANYRERVEDARLQAVAEHVRQWLFGKPTGAKKPPAPKARPAPSIQVEEEKSDRPNLRLFAG